MINFDNYVNENKTKHNKNWPYIPDHPYRILIIGGSGSGKNILLLNLMENQPDIHKIYLYAKDPYSKASIQIYVNKIENRLTFKIKNGYSLELLTPETMQLLGSTKNKITKDKNDENVLHLEITEVVLVHCNIVNNDYQQDSRVLYTFVPNKPFGSLLEISPTNHIF